MNANLKSKNRTTEAFNKLIFEFSNNLLGKQATTNSPRTPIVSTQNFDDLSLFERTLTVVNTPILEQLKYHYLKDLMVVSKSLYLLFNTSTEITPIREFWERTIICIKNENIDTQAMINFAESHNLECYLGLYRNCRESDDVISSLLLHAKSFPKELKKKSYQLEFQT